MFDKEQLLRVVFGRLDWEVINSTSIDERLWTPAFAGMTACQFTLVLKPEVLTYLREPIFEESISPKGENHE